MQNFHIIRAATLLAGVHFCAILIASGGISTSSYDTPSYLEIQNAIISQDGSNAIVTVMRSGDFRNIASVDYATHDGTAVAGEDYTPVGGRLVFQGGEGIKTISIAILAGTLSVSDEMFQVVLSNPGTSAIITRDTATVTIKDTPPAPPRILVRPNGNGGIILSWPAARTDCVLEKADNTIGSVWTAVGTAPLIVGDQCTYTELASESKYFFRLRVQ